MKSRFIKIMVVLLVVCTMVACGNGNNADTPSTTESLTPSDNEEAVTDGEKTAPPVYDLG